MLLLATAGCAGRLVVGVCGGECIESIIVRKDNPNTEQPKANRCRTCTFTTSQVTGYVLWQLGKGQIDFFETGRTGLEVYRHYFLRIVPGGKNKVKWTNTVVAMICPMDWTSLRRQTMSTCRKKRYSREMHLSQILQRRSCLKENSNNIPRPPPQHRVQSESTAFTNKPYDEAYEISQDLSMAESYDGREKVSRKS